MNDTAPQVSVVVPTYNTAAYIGEALESIFAKAYSNYEVIVVNDGSPDTPELERVLERFSGRITYLKKPNGGVASARNVGIRVSSGEYIAMLDSDDLFKPQWMRVQVDYLQKHPEIDMVYGDGIVFGTGIPESLVSRLNPSNGSATFEALVRERCCVPTAGVLVRRSAIFAVGLLDEDLRWGEDFDLWLRLAKEGHPIGYHRDVIFRYRCHAGGVTSQATTLPRYASLVLAKMLRRDDLTPEERRAAEEARDLFAARVLLHEGKAAFAAENFPTAVEKLASANATLRRPRLGLAVALLRVCPRVVWHARRVFSQGKP